MRKNIDMIKEKKLAESNDFEGFGDIDSSHSSKAAKLKDFLARSKAST